MDIKSPSIPLFQRGKPVEFSNGKSRLILPQVNGHCMQLFLDEIAARYRHENVVMVVDGAGWHRSKELELAENVRTVFLPPYAPELNPQEHI